MPYKSNATLPDNVKNVLPAYAQDIYRAAFNNAWEEYKDSKLRQEDNSREETAHKVAWGAVKQSYRKGPEESGEWVKK
ncbi:ChaB family protein [Yersinia kristensenii]|uniref:ChaB family protein n=2 Tax=Yersinia kristensenii TaxID=28152 RepID=UPI0005E59173|nr:ChaB family protein [Yersinia kristensenii]MDA5477448.1 ChaB family protein [Yersinia kristensenii]MDA5505876.1 ChaB family protein [Yersinia kristensenii]NIK96262.1 cation transport regulator ChaB [Yersinia kristensenii]NIL08504.1 cation transport regulator ChaB [Yersinia kristensenii]PJE83635.1 cation transport regulator ChaB [Yersinia kristensenii]